MGWFRGLTCRRSEREELSVSHVLYADDTLILCESEREREQLLHLRGVLLAFEAVSGLRMNLAKSDASSINAEHCISDLTDIMGYRVEQLLTSYSRPRS